VRLLFGSLLFVALGATIHAQQPTAPSDNEKQNQAPQVVGPRDGGVDEVLQSIYIPTVQNAPFEATVHTQWIRQLPGSGTFTLVNQRQVARNSLGQVYQERWYLVPRGGKQESKMYLIQIADPIAHTLHSCYLLLEPHRCTLEDFSEPLMSSYHPAPAQTGSFPDGNGYLIHEDLGTKDISGVETTGTRDTTTYNQGVIGNDQPFSMKREFWFAASLGVNLESEVANPMYGTQIFNLTGVSTFAPDPKLFEVPAGFELVDRRKHPAPPAPSE